MTEKIIDYVNRELNERFGWKRDISTLSEPWQEILIKQTDRFLQQQPNLSTTKIFKYVTWGLLVGTLFSIGIWALPGIQTHWILGTISTASMTLLTLLTLSFWQEGKIRVRDEREKFDAILSSTQEERYGDIHLHNLLGINTKRIQRRMGRELDSAALATCRTWNWGDPDLVL